MWRYLIPLALMMETVALGQFGRSLVGKKVNEVYILQEVATGQRVIHSVTLLPSEIQRTVGNFRQREIGPEEMPEQLRELDSIAPNAMCSKGWQVDERTLTPEALHNNAKVQTLVELLRTRHDNLLTQISNRPKDVSKARYSLGEDVAALGLAGRTDALVFAKISSQANTWAVSMVISLVDPSSGEVLAHVQSSWGGGAHRKVDLGKATESLLKQLQEIP